VVATSTGMKQRGSNLEFDLSHMLSALLAFAQNLGGNRFMFLTVPFLGGFALLAFYLLANRLLQHPVWALAATATLALLMPQTSFARDSTTEILIQILLFTAIWLLCDRRTLSAAGTALCRAHARSCRRCTSTGLFPGVPGGVAVGCTPDNGKRRTETRAVVGRGHRGRHRDRALDLVLWSATTCRSSTATSNGS
jgi:hypothetical protein